MLTSSTRVTSTIVKQTSDTGETVRRMHGTLHRVSKKQVALLWQRDRATRLSVEILQLQNIAIVWHY